MAVRGWSTPTTTASRSSTRLAASPAPFGHRGNDPAGEGPFDNPSDLAFDELGFVHVTDSHNDRVQVFDPEGRFVSQFGSSGQADGQFWVPRGTAFDRDGHFLASCGSEGSGAGQFNMPYGVAVLGRELLVADNQNQRIVRLGLDWASGG